MNEPEKKRNIVACLNGLDDILFSKIVEDPAACGEILQTLAEEEDLQLVWAVPQFALRNAGSRSVVLDALCKDTRNRERGRKRFSRGICERGGQRRE